MLAINLLLYSTSNSIQRVAKNEPTTLCCVKSNIFTSYALVNVITFKRLIYRYIACMGTSKIEWSILMSAEGGTKKHTLCILETRTNSFKIVLTIARE